MPSTILLIVSSNGIFVNNDSTSFYASSSPSFKVLTEDKMLGGFCVSLREYLFLHKGLK